MFFSWRSIRTLFNILLIIFTISINYFINTIKNIENCPCKSDWKIKNGITLSNIFIILSLINIIIPVNRIINSLPLIGNLFMFLYCILLFALLYIVTSMSNELSESNCDSCKLEHINLLYNMFKDVNSQRGKLNQEVFETMAVETKDWGITIVRVELKEIEPPDDVQETMNMVIKAENDKQSAIDFANARETKSDGERRAQIKEAEGVRQSLILEAEGQSQAIERVAEARAKEIQLVNEAAEKLNMRSVTF